MRRAFACLSLLAGFTMALAPAGVAYDTLGPDNSFQVQSWLLGEPNLDQDIAQAFQCWQGGELESITLSITHYAFQNVYDVKLHADNCGQPGTLLQTWAGVQAPADSILVLTPATTVDLTQGYNYWVAVSTPLGGANTVGGWNYDNHVGNNTFFLFSQNGNAFAPQCGRRSGMRVEVVGGATPECEGDINGDGSVTLTDLAILLARFGLVCP